MEADLPEEEKRGFRFLYRTDKGSIDRATWWKGTVPLAVIAVAATALWLVVRPYTHDALNQKPAMALMAYLYLLIFAFGTLLLLVCEYNLSAKRFFARGLPRALAAVFPLSLLLAGACDWYIPRSNGALPGWSIWLVLIVVAGVVIWNVIELGVRQVR
jgi:hypothetical protein